MENKKIVTYIELTIAQEFIEEVLPKAISTKNFIQEEKGNEIFILSSKEDEPNVLVIFAIYASEIAYKWHLKQEYVKEFFAFLEGKLLIAPNVLRLKELI